MLTQDVVSLGHKSGLAMVAGNGESRIMLNRLAFFCVRLDRLGIVGAVGAPIVRTGKLSADSLDFYFAGGGALGDGDCALGLMVCLAVGLEAGLCCSAGEFLFASLADEGIGAGGGVRHG